MWTDVLRGFEFALLVKFIEKKDKDKMEKTKKKLKTLRLESNQKYFLILSLEWIKD